MLQCGGRNSHRGVEIVGSAQVHKWRGRVVYSLSQQIGALFQFQYQFRFRPLAVSIRIQSRGPLQSAILLCALQVHVCVESNDERSLYSSYSTF